MRRTIHLSEIPKEFRNKHKLLGRGSTAIVFQKDKNTAIMFVRDPMKSEWLTKSWGLSIGKHSYEVKPKENYQLSNSLGDIHVIELPLLRKLSAKNRKLARQLIKSFNDIKNKMCGYRVTIDCLLKIQSKFNPDRYPESLFYNLIDFLLNYSENQWHFDLAIRDILEDSKGQLVLLDPIVSKEAIDWIYNRKV